MSTRGDESGGPVLFPPNFPFLRPFADKLCTIPWVLSANGDIEARFNSCWSIIVYDAQDDRLSFIADMRQKTDDRRDSWGGKVYFAADATRKLTTVIVEKLREFMRDDRDICRLMDTLRERIPEIPVLDLPANMEG